MLNHTASTRRAVIRRAHKTNVASQRPVIQTYQSCARPTAVMFLPLPFLFVLRADGKLVHPQRANVFEDGDTYNIPSFAHFLTVYGPPPPVPVN